MSSGHDITPPAVLDAAADWYARLASGDVTDVDIERHMEWLLEDPAHADAYERVALAMRSADALEGVVRTTFAQDFTVESKPKWHGLFANLGWPRLATVAAAAMALLFGVIFPGTGFYDEPSLPHQYVAEGASVRTVELADGSRVSLFGGSGMTVAISDDMRVVTLEAGRAFFDVVPNPTRPFYVRTANRQVKVVGTRFEVIRAEGFDRVAVNHGLVAVEPLDHEASATQAPLLIEPGVVAIFDENETEPVMAHVPAETVGAWARGVLTFRDAALIDVVSRIDALFPTVSVRLASGADLNIRFSGVIQVSTAEQMARQLAGFMDLDLDVSDFEIIFTANQ
ncbi:FecR family protein [Kordiimonas sp.]|uniref:FecR family protein n=1 Tax=Kordiimonas sp. TaxID=1970157 RepID=UPI003B519921